MYSDRRKRINLKEILKLIYRYTGSASSPFMGIWGYSITEIAERKLIEDVCQAKGCNGKSPLVW
jgi:hypothetical protein